MICRGLLVVGLFTGLVVSEVMAQGGAPSVLLKVRKSPGGQGQVVSYNLEAETLVVSLRMPSGRAEQVEVSRHHVSPRAWRALSEIGRAFRAANDKSLIDEPIEVEGRFGDKGTIVAFNADTNAVVVDFNGQQSREMPVSQLKARTWQAAKAKIGRSLPPTVAPEAKKSNEEESESDERT